MRQLCCVYMDYQSDSIFTVLALHFLGNYDRLLSPSVQAPFATYHTICIVAPSAGVNGNVCSRVSVMVPP